MDGDGDGEGLIFDLLLLDVDESEALKTSKIRSDITSGSDRLGPAMARWVPALLSDEWVTVRSGGGCGVMVAGGGSSEKMVMMWWDVVVDLVGSMCLIRVGF